MTSKDLYAADAQSMKYTMHITFRNIFADCMTLGLISSEWRRNYSDCTMTSRLLFSLAQTQCTANDTEGDRTVND